VHFRSPLGAIITVAGGATLSETNDDPTGHVALAFGVAGAYYVGVSCFPAQDFAQEFTL